MTAIAIIGFGEAGRLFASDLRRARPAPPEFELCRLRLLLRLNQIAEPGIMNARCPCERRFEISMIREDQRTSNRSDTGLARFCRECRNLSCTYMAM
jgi:hypothetical protein